MMSNSLEQEIKEQSNGSGIDNLKTFHPNCIPVLLLSGDSTFLYVVHKSR